MFSSSQWRLTEHIEEVQEGRTEVMKGGGGGGLWRGEEMVTLPISRLQKRVVLLHSSFHQINRPQLSGKKLLRTALLLLSSPPWHLVKTPLPPSCHWYVPLWAAVSLTLLRVKVSRRTWEQWAAVDYVTALLAFPQLWRTFVLFLFILSPGFIIIFCLARRV